VAGNLAFRFHRPRIWLGEGIRAVLRIPVANVIAIMAGRRAVVTCLRSLTGQVPQWDKTHHDAHPAQLLGGNAPFQVRKARAA
jgi:adsorption protein B